MTLLFLSKVIISDLIYPEYNTTYLTLTLIRHLDFTRNQVLFLFTFQVKATKLCKCSYNVAFSQNHHFVVNNPGLGISCMAVSIGMRNNLLLIGFAIHNEEKVNRELIEMEE